ncbi:DUF2325 domain-containing protein [Denitratisoma sp. agr-D3]
MMWLVQGNAMQALIVGADRVDTLRAEILRSGSRLGIESVAHWPGRKVSDCRRTIPHCTRLVIFVCDRTNHMLMRNVRKQAESMAIPMVFCRHSVLEIHACLAGLAKES